MATGISASIGEEPDDRELQGLSGYSITEESTPVDPSDTTGAAGRFTLNFFRGQLSAKDARLMNRKTIRLEDKAQGFTTGIARTPSMSQGVVSLGVDLRTALLSVRRTAAPYSGTVTGYVEYILSLVNITTGVVIDSSFDDMDIVAPGWNNEVWLQLKKLAVAKGAEISLASGNIVFRPLRGRETVDFRDADYSWSSDDTGLALSVDGVWYENHWVTDSLVYPLGGWNDDVKILNVDADETLEFDEAIDGSLTSLIQPVAVDYVDRNELSSSVYAVVGSDDKPILAAQWQAAGGNIAVSIGDDTRSVVIKITGASIPELAPFRIAVVAGPSDTYSSLRILGSGVTYKKHEITRSTGVSPDLASAEIGANVENEFFADLGEFRDRFAWTMTRYSGPRHTITVRTRGVNRLDASQSYQYPTIADFNLYAIDRGWETIADFNAGVDADTIAEFNAFWTARVADDFANQAFGNIAGSRTNRDGFWFRIRAATIGPDIISYNAENDTCVGDLNDYLTRDFGGDGFYDGISAAIDAIRPPVIVTSDPDPEVVDFTYPAANEHPDGTSVMIDLGIVTIADFNEIWAGKTFEEFNAGPLLWGEEI